MEKEKKIKKDINFLDTKIKLLELTDEDKDELDLICDDYFFYKGALNYIEKKKYKDKLKERGMIGQNWFCTDKIDYEPTQLVDNIAGELINKQARFFLGKEPYLFFKINNYDELTKIKDVKELKNKLEKYRSFIDKVLDSNDFWANMLKAFKLATVTKRILVRLEADYKEDVRLYYHDSTDFNYEYDSKGNLIKLILVTLQGYDYDLEDYIINKYTYYMEESCRLKTEVFVNSQLDKPISESDEETIYPRIPAVVFFNEKDFIEKKGKSDISQLRDLQIQYNKRLSDFSDALRFQMFGGTSVIDGSAETVNNLTIAPNSLLAIETSDVARDSSQQAKINRIESSFSNAEPVINYLGLLKDSMGDKLSIPRKDSLKEIPSAKALKFVYNDLIARCYEKWRDWEKGIFTLIDLIIFCCDKLNCYEEFEREWLTLSFTKILEKNFPIPEDREDAKRLAMEEVNNNVRSHRSYIKDYGNEEDYVAEFQEIIEDLQVVNGATMDPLTKALAEEDDKEIVDGD